MKKCFKLFAAALFALASFVPAQADVLTVYDGDDTSEKSPIYGWYYDTPGYTVQTIMHADSLTPMQGAFIKSMKFYPDGDAGSLLNGGKLAVSLGTTDKAVFSQYDSPLEGLTKVAEITMTEGDPEIVINFDTPFNYEGGNLVIETKVIEKGNYPNNYFKGRNAHVNNVLLKSTYSTNVESFYPKTTFEYDVMDNLAVIDTEEIAFGRLYLDSEVFAKSIRIANQGKYPFTPTLSGLEAPFSVEAVSEVYPRETKDILVTFTPNILGEFNQTLIVDCGAAGRFEVAVSGSCVEVPAEVVVADGELLSNTVPVNTMNYDRDNSGNVSQMIYTEDLLADLVGKKINMIRFESATANKYMADGNLQLSIKAVEEGAFASATPYTEMTVVANASPENGVITFEFTEPYQYDGGNLAIEVLVTEKGAYGVEKFYGIEKEGASYAYFWDLGYETHVYNFLPKATFGYVKEDTPEPPVIRGDVDGNGEVGIADATALIDMLLSGAETPKEADANLDGEVGIADVTCIIDYLLSGSWPN